MILQNVVGHYITKLMYRPRPSLSNLIGKYRASNTDTVSNTRHFFIFRTKTRMPQWMHFINVQPSEVKTCSALVFYQAQLKVFGNQNKGQVTLKIFP